MNQLISLVSGRLGKIIFAVPIALFGVFHILGANSMAGMVPIPGGALWMYVTGVCLIAGAVGIATNIRGLGKLAAFLTGVLVLIFAMSVQLPGVLRGGDTAMMYQVSLLKDLIIAGGAWVCPAPITTNVLNGACNSARQRESRLLRPGVRIRSASAVRGMTSDATPGGHGKAPRSSGSRTCP